MLETVGVSAIFAGVLAAFIRRSWKKCSRERNSNSSFLAAKSKSVPPSSAPESTSRYDSWKVHFGQFLRAFTWINVLFFLRTGNCNGRKRVTCNFCGRGTRREERQVKWDVVGRTERGCATRFCAINRASFLQDRWKWNFGRGPSVYILTIELGCRRFIAGLFE